jgi:RNA polymerase sigma factor (sigma-70 family)
MKAAGPTVATPVEVEMGVLEALNRLSVQQRAAVLLTYWGDLSTEAVAERMGISVGAVKRHLARARKRLQEWLS